MKVFKITSIVLLALLAMSNANAQDGRPPWIVGLGTNFIDNDGKASQLFDFKNGWNTVYYPSRLSAEKIIGEGFSAEAVATYNRFKVGKIFNGKTLTEVRSYVGVDISGKYDLNEQVGETMWFDPFVMAGFGFTHVQNGKAVLVPEFREKDLNTGNVNVGIGFNLWITKDFALNLQTMGKFTFEGKTASNYLQHSAAITYKIELDKNNFYKSSGRFKAATNIVDHIKDLRDGRQPPPANSAD